MSKTTFNCDFCGNPKTAWTYQYNRNKNHYCSRPCKDAHHKQLYSSGLDRKQYESQYWSKPENKNRRKVKTKLAYVKRVNKMGDSLKKIMLNRAKARAKKQGCPFSLTINDFDIPKSCPVLGFDLEVSEGSGGNYNSPSLDKIIPQLGYVKGNVAVISMRANLIKQDATADEVQKVADFIRSFCQPEGLQ